MCPANSPSRAMVKARARSRNLSSKDLRCSRQKIAVMAAEKTKTGSTAPRTKIMRWDRIFMGPGSVHRRASNLTRSKHDHRLATLLKKNHSNAAMRKADYHRVSSSSGQVLYDGLQFMNIKEIGKIG